MARRLRKSERKSKSEMETMRERGRRGWENRGLAALSSRVVRPAPHAALESRALQRPKVEEAFIKR